MNYFCSELYARQKSERNFNFPLLAVIKCPQIPIVSFSSGDDNELSHSCLYYFCFVPCRWQGPKKIKTRLSFVGVRKIAYHTQGIFQYHIHLQHMATCVCH